MLIHLFVIVLLNLGGFARLLAMKYVLIVKWVKFLDWCFGKHFLHIC